MIDFIRSVLGTYSPVTYSVYSAAADAFEDIVPSGLAGVDWAYVIAGAAFLIVLYCSLKLLGALICKIF